MPLNERWACQHRERDRSHGNPRVEGTDRFWLASAAQADLVDHRKVTKPALAWSHSYPRQELRGIEGGNRRIVAEVASKLGLGHALASTNVDMLAPEHAQKGLTGIGQPVQQAGKFPEFPLSPLKSSDLTERYRLAGGPRNGKRSKFTFDLSGRSTADTRNLTCDEQPGDGSFHVRRVIDDPPSARLAPVALCADLSEKLGGGSEAKSNAETIALEFVDRPAVDSADHKSIETLVSLRFQNNVLE